MASFLESVGITLCFGALVVLWRVSVASEQRLTRKLHQAIDAGAVDEVQAMLAKHTFANLRSVVIATAVVRAAESRQLAVLDFLLSPEVKPVSLTQKFESFLYDQSLRGGWRGVVLWRSRRAHPFLPWRDLSSRDKFRLRSLATRGVGVEPSKIFLRHHFGKWTVVV